MSYLVTRGKGPVGIDRPIPDIPSALRLACRLISEGYVNVAIQDGKGKNISGADLIACCKRERTLTPDLRAISN
jgi:hypothetical protein